MSGNASSQNKRRPDRAAFVIAVVLALAGIVMAWSTVLATEAAGYTAVGPKTVPYIVAACLFGLGIWTALEAWRGDFPEREEQNINPILWLIGGLTVQLLAIKTVGFSIGAGLMFAAAAKAFGLGPFTKTLPIGIVFSFAIWFIFALGLQLTLPEGPVETFVRSLFKAS